MLSTSLAFMAVVIVTFDFALSGAKNVMLLDNNHKMVMSWSPKSACTKMVEMFWNQMGLRRGEYYPRKSFIHTYRPQFYKTYGRVTDAILADKSYYKFKVVRNPWDRAVSSYNHLMLTKQSKYLFHNTVLREFLTKRKYIFPSESTGFSFEEFMTLFVELDGSDLQNNYQQDHNDQTNLHVQRQVEELEYKKWKKGGDLLFNRIVKLENFEADIALVNHESGMNYSYPIGDDAHDAHRHVLDVDAYVGNLSWSKLKNNIPANYAKYYNRRTKQLVQHLYRVDIDLYNYSYPYARTY